MDVYNLKVRLGGSLLNEVAKLAISTPEVIILRRLHGEDAIVDVKPAGDWEDHYGGVQKVRNEDHEYEEQDVSFDPEVERARLDTIYGRGLAGLEEEQKTSVAKMFGEGYVPLPETLQEFKQKPAPKTRTAEVNIPPRNTGKKPDPLNAVM